VQREHANGRQLGFAVHHGHRARRPFAALLRLGLSAQARGREAAPTKDDVERVWDAMNLDAETEAEELQDIRVALDAFLAPYRSSED
jgi:hypothetical protein